MARQSSIKRRDFLRLSAGAGAGAMLAACAPSAAGPAAGPKTDTARLVVGVPSLDRQSFSPIIGNGPAEHQVVRHIKEALIFSDPATGALKPGLAESWSASPDGKVWSFKLRPNIPFHDGSGTVTSEDVKFSWGQFISPDSTFGTTATETRQAVDNNMVNFEIVNPLEFRVRASKPVYTLDNTLSTILKALKIESKKYWEANPQRALTHPVGTGPFKFVSSNPGLDVTIEAVDKHWFRTSNFKQIIFRQVADDGARLAQIQGGALDLTALPLSLAAEAKKGGLKILSIPQTGTMSVQLGGQYEGDPRPGIFDRKSPWIQADTPAKGLAIRQALSLAINRQVIIDTLMAGKGTLIHAPIVEFPSNPKLVDPSWKLPAYDVAQAKAKLAEGGYPNGFELTMMVYENSPGSGGVAVNEAVAGMWEAIGIKVKRQITDQTLIRPHLANRTTNGMAFAYVTPYFPEAQTAFQSIYQVSSALSIWNDPVITAAIPRWAAEPDRDKRYAITREVLTSLMASMRAIPLFTIDLTFIVSDKVGTWSPMAGVQEITELDGITPKNP